MMGINDVYGWWENPGLARLPRDKMLRVVRHVASVGCLAYVAAWGLLLLACLLFGGCRSGQQVVVAVKTDTLYVSKAVRDSVWLHDSVHVVERESGDTVYVMHDRWRTKYVERVRHDTLREVAHDTMIVERLVSGKTQRGRGVVWWVGVAAALMGIVIILYLFFTDIKK